MTVRTLSSLVGVALLLGTLTSTSLAATLTVTSGLQLRLESGTGVTAGTGGVASWSDGLGNTASQSDTTRRPQLIANASPNGQQPVLRFDGINDQLDFANIAQATASSIFIVYSSDPTGDTSQQLIGRTGASPSPYAQNTTTGDPYFYPYGLYGTSITGMNVVEFSYDTAPALDTGRIAVNGGAATTGAANAPLGDWNSIAYTGAGQRFKGDIAAVLIYDTQLSSGDTAAVVNYLYQQYLPEPASLSLLAVGGLALRRRAAHGRR